MNSTNTTDGTELKIPSFKELLEVYPRLAADQRKRTGGKPAEHTVYGTLLGVTRIIDASGIGYDSPYTALTTKILDTTCEQLRQTLKPITVKAYLQSLQNITARWSHLRYEEIGYKVESIRIPSFFVPPFRYREKSKEIKTKVIEWFTDPKLPKYDPDIWFLSTMMLQFGMRNSDVKLLKWDNFQEEMDGVYLTYTPHKTRLSSGRVVHWPVPRPVWELICEYRKDHSKAPFCWDDLNKVPPHHNYLGTTEKKKTGRKVINHFSISVLRLNRIMREFGFDGSKASYELRKLCACAMYKNFGQEATSSLLGDNIDTILKHYADPSAIGKVVNVADIL